LPPCLQSGDVVSFHGFRDADLSALKEHSAAYFPAVPLSMGEVSVSGKNWGEATVRGSQLVFAVANKPAFHVNCSDISAVSQQGKTDVLLEFAVDDTTGATEKDALFELSFHVPPTSQVHAAPAPAEGEEDAAPVPAKVLADAILTRASVGPITGEPIALFSEVAVLIPRGRFSLEMHGATMRLVGQAADFKVQYTSILRLFVLPRPAAPTTLAVLALDPPIRRGATFYPHLVLQFSAEEEVEMEPSVPPELADKYAGRLEPRYSGAEADVFAKVLKALAGTKVTRAGTFQSPSGGSAVRCVHKADDGHLYPLEKAFFFLPKPPIFIRHDEVAEVEFERNAGGGKTFDIKISLTTDQSYRFTNIARSEYDNLMAFLTAKRLPVASLAAPQRDLPAGIGLSDSDDEGMGMPGGGGEDEDSEEDADFKAASGPSGSESSSESEGEEGGEAGGGTPAEKPAKPKKRKETKEKKAADGKPEKKKRAKKDPNGARCAFSVVQTCGCPNTPCFSQRQRRACRLSCFSAKSGVRRSLRRTRGCPSARSARRWARRGRRSPPRSARRSMRRLPQTRSAFCARTARTRRARRRATSRRAMAGRVTKRQTWMSNVGTCYPAHPRYRSERSAQRV